MKVNIKHSEDLVRDTDSMAILNVNKGALMRDALYKQNLKRDKEVDQAINKLNDDVSSIKNDLSKIIELLSSRGQ